MRTDFTCPVCKKDGPEREGSTTIKAHDGEEVYYHLKCECGNRWTEIYMTDVTGEDSLE